MTLASTTLQASLAKMFDPNNSAFVGFPATSALAANNFANAYASYAAAATDAGGNALAVSSKTGFAAALSGLTNSGTALSCATAFGNAFTAFWTGASFTPARPPPSGVGGDGLFASVASSVVTAAPGSTLQAALQAIFAATSASGSTQAALIASALHMATTTAVVVLITGLDTTPAASGGPLPITNTGVVS